ncbi:MAG TPA: hypothetical protein VMV51_02390 [Gemmatimonadaceae bacterium]|nr:hypothetical protein [Gemmatimonadaceae bacterium]
MLAFLDVFCRALAARDRLAIQRQLRHPLARTLPPSVRAEALAIARAGEHGHLAPTRTLHFYYQTLQLLASSEHVRFDASFFQSAGPDRLPATSFTATR